jgi:hypothetical protein
MNKPKIEIQGYEVVATNCPDGDAALDLAEQRLLEIEKRVADVDAERTALNREKYILARWLKGARGTREQATN